jgi:DNA polymerase
MGERAACVRDPERWALLYRVLWRLTHGEPRLLDVVVDRDVARLVAMDKTVRRDVHKLHAFVRFRAVPITSADVCYVAWFEPEHHVLEYGAPFFARRFAPMLWSILTPDRSAHWDGASLTFGPGVPRADAPGDDPLEELWRTYYANVFNPARLKTRAMRAEMPKKYWANLPEARLIPDLVSGAPRRVREMIDRLRARDDEA